MNFSRLERIQTQLILRVVVTVPRLIQDVPFWELKETNVFYLPTPKRWTERRTRCLQRLEVCFPRFQAQDPPDLWIEPETDSIH